MNNEKIEAICLTLGQDFLHKIYPGGEKKIREILERMNDSDRYNWMQFCGSGIPTKTVQFCYVIWGGKVQYRCDIKEFKVKDSGGFWGRWIIKSIQKP